MAKFRQFDAAYLVSPGRRTKYAIPVTIQSVATGWHGYVREIPLYVVHNPNHRLDGREFLEQRLRPVTWRTRLKYLLTPKHSARYGYTPPVSDHP